MFIDAILLLDGMLPVILSSLYSSFYFELSYYNTAVSCL